MKQQETFVSVMSTVLCHGVLNMQETKYGMQPTKEILREGMKHGFKRMCIVYERLVAKVCFFIYVIMYILLCVCVCVCLLHFMFVDGR
jgi:hypothetical protein